MYEMLNEVVGLVPIFHFILFLFSKGVEGTLTSHPPTLYCYPFVGNLYQMSLSLKWNSSVWGLDQLSVYLSC